ncbi:caspase family protein [Micromonospora sp. NPDC051196]|uniref:effector-associated domain 2-containing protein n=1 Tax=Micromonospora sp. NPDC051196 TaxID=3155281 RepID=UPI0034395876
MTDRAPQVRAVVVGVERYDVGAEWNLDGPVRDACRYVQWLRGHGVDDESVTLLASPLPGNEAPLAQLGLPVRPAEQAVVYDVLTRELPADEADLLIVVWGGHGVIDGDGNRRLFYADATVPDKRNLDLNALMRTLMTAYFPHPRHQLLVVDACQNLVSELQYVNLLPHQTLPTHPTLMPGRDQHALVAASPGELALNDSTRRTGLFSDELLQALADPAAGWPPDVDQLATHLDRRFTQLRAAGATSQRPPYLWQRTPAREGVVFDLGTARPARMSLAALGAIVDAMLDVDELASVPNLQQFISLLPSDIRGAVPYAGSPRMDLVRLLRTCEMYETGREALTTVLSLAMANRADLTRTLDALDRHWPA